MERRRFMWEFKLEAVRLIKERGVSSQSSPRLNLLRQLGVPNKNSALIPFATAPCGER